MNVEEAATKLWNVFFKLDAETLPMAVLEKKARWIRKRMAGDPRAEIIVKSLLARRLVLGKVVEATER